MKIIEIEARQIIDARGIPTVETEIWREGEVSGRASVPSEVSTGGAQTKTGSVCRGERTTKHNELLRIECGNDGLQLSNPFNL